MEEIITEASSMRNAGRRCITCGGLGPFNRKKSSKDGLNKKCRSCSKAYCDAWRKANPERTREHTARSNSKKRLHLEKYRKFNREYATEWRRTYPERVLHKAAKHRAKKMNLRFNIEVEDVVIPGYCPLLGIPLRRGTKTSAWSPTLDRKDSALGYVKGNVWVISHKANAMKQDASRSELRVFAERVLQHLDAGLL